MKKNIKSIFSNKVVSYFIIPLALLLFWFVASFLTYHKISFSVLTYGPSGSDGIISSPGKLLKGSSVKGQFVGKDNHLGILMLRFNNFVKPDYSGEDVLQFRIREKGQQNWQYVNNYRSGLLEHQLLFPFGFPIIENSSGKIYEFEITSLYGNNRNAIAINEQRPTIITGYQYPRVEITGSKKRAISFALKKVNSLFTDVDFILFSFLFLIPFVFYILGKFIIKRFGYTNSAFPLVVIFLMFADILLLKEVYIGILLIILIGWVLLIKMCRLESTVSFLVAFILLLLWPPIIYLGLTEVGSKINIWVYAFLLIGAIQVIFEYKYNLKNRVGYKSFVKGIIGIHEKI